jgi:hypothetical protein
MNGEYCNVVTTQDLLLARRDGRTIWGCQCYRMFTSALPTSRDRTASTERSSASLNLN